jgi:hypothetical protein
MDVNCRDLKKEIVLMELYNNAKTQGYGYLQHVNGDMTEEEANGHFKQYSYFDYIKGCVLKVNFNNYPMIDSYLYDRDNGKDAMQKCIDKLSN